jgi:WD40 repeat protein
MTFQNLCQAVSARKALQATQQADGGWARPGLLIAKYSHNGAVTSVSINSTGSRVVSVGDGEARFWESHPSRTHQPGIAARIGTFKGTFERVSEADGAPKSLSGPTFFLSSEYGEVKKALYFPVLSAQHSLKDLEEHLVVVVWSSNQLHLFNVSDLTGPLVKIDKALSDVRACKVFGDGNVAIGCGDGSLSLWSFSLAKLKEHVKAPERNATSPDRHASEHEESMAAKLFRAADSDQSGFLDSEELAVILRDLAANAGNHLSALQVSIEVQACMGEYAGANGVVSLESFEQYTASCKLFSLQLSKSNMALLQSVAAGMASRRSLASRMEICQLLDASHQGAVLDMACCPRSEFLASGSVDHTVCVWRLKRLYEDVHVAAGGPRLLQGHKVKAWSGQHGSYVQVCVSLACVSLCACVCVRVCLSAGASFLSNRVFVRRLCVPVCVCV